MAVKRRRKPTETSSFGSSRREAHDSSKFYSRKLYEPRNIVVEGGKEKKVDKRYLDSIICKSSEKMNELPDSSVHLVVTSPPYNVGKEYDEDLTLDQHRQLLRKVFSEVFRVLVFGGRVCVNVANLGRKPYIPIHRHVIEDLTDLGFLMRGEVIWSKASSAGTSTAWGSWKSATNPSLRDIHEYILIFSKGTYSRVRGMKSDTVTREEFLAFTKSVWEFPAESARRIGHPAPFPLELPYRCIQLYSFRDDIVLDPFCGAATTCLAAMKTGRHFVGYELRKEYAELAAERIRNSPGRKIAERTNIGRVE